MLWVYLWVKLYNVSSNHIFVSNKIALLHTELLVRSETTTVENLTADSV